MGTITNKRKALSVKEKFKAIRYIEDGRKKTDMWREFGLVNFTFKKIRKKSTTEESGKSRTD